MKRTVLHPEQSQKLSVRRPRESDWLKILTVLRSGNLHNIGGSEMAEFPLSDCFIGELDHQVVGVCGYAQVGPENAKCTLTAVLPQYRQCGVATAIKTRVVDYLKDAGIKELYSNCDNATTIAWNIKHFGFRPTGIVIPKMEPFGRGDVHHWTNLVAHL